MELREKIGRIISGYGKHYQIAEVTGNAIADLILDIPEIKEALELRAHGETPLSAATRMPRL